MKSALILLLATLVLAEGKPPVESPSDKDDVGMAAGFVQATNDSLADRDGLDLLLTEEQRKILYEGGSWRAGSLSYFNQFKWADGIIPYKFASDVFWAAQKTSIRQAMDHIEQETCITFVERTNEKDWIEIVSDRGCYSYLGNIHQGRQQLSLQLSGCHQFGTYLHELCHAIGLIHEHQHPNRDNFVQYHQENVKSGKHSQLRKYSRNLVNTLGVEYDFSSIMHYEFRAFSVDRFKPTLMTKDTFMEKHVGRRWGRMISYGDAMHINKLYQCDRKCPGPFAPCNGFINKDCQCVTYESYNERLCRNDPEQEAWCYKQVIYGYCKHADDYKQIHCAKACDFCPKYRPGHNGLAQPESCKNQYSDEAKCREWAREGQCDSYPKWMKRYCRKACNACNEQIGVCANVLDDDECESYATSIWYGYCTSPKWWGIEARERCPDACKVCKA